MISLTVNNIKDILLTIIVMIVTFFGIAFSLIQLYSSPDGNTYSLYGSINFIATSIFLFIFSYTLTKNVQKFLKWLDFMTITFFTVTGIILTLICIYAFPLEGYIDPFASALFFLGSMISASGLLLIANQPKSY